MLALFMNLPRRILSKLHPIVAGVYRKKDKFVSREEAASTLRAKRVFSSMSPEVFELFLSECIVDLSAAHAPNTCQLAFTKQAEAEVYYRTPMEIPMISRSIIGKYDFHSVPLTYLTNHKHPSTILTPADVKWVCQEYGCSSDSVNGDCSSNPDGSSTSVSGRRHIEFSHSHFWPLEDPVSFADAMVDIICQDV
jgi:hypothetical protein